MKKILMVALVVCLGFFFNPKCRAETFFISDTHFGNARTMKVCRRPFRSVDEMNEKLINSWNDVVRDEDEVYILGDFASDFYTKEDVFNILEQLKGRKHLIIGNHDEVWLEQCTEDELLKYFEDLPEHMTVLNWGNQKLALCHYPLLDFRGIVIHGHIHNFKNRQSGWNIIKNNRLILNAGVDVNDYRPVTFLELNFYNQIFKNQGRNFR